MIFLRRIIYVVLSIGALGCATLAFFTLTRQLRESKDAASTAPSSGHFVEIADGKIFVQELGLPEQPAVILIHGTGSWSEIWKDTARPLGDAGFHVVAIDLPPFGYSSKYSDSDDYSREKQAVRILQTIQALHLKNPTLVAHSVGSRPTVEAVLSDPTIVKKLILVAPALGYPQKQDQPFEFQENNPSLLVRLFFSAVKLRNAVISTYGTNPLFMKNIFSSFVYDKSSITSERVDIIKKPMNVRGTTQAYGDWLQYLVVSKDSSLSSHFENLKKITPPTYLIWGDKDTVTPLWAGEKLQQLIPAAQIKIIKNVGHMPYLENTKEFNDDLIEFLKK